MQGICRKSTRLELLNQIVALPFGIAENQAQPVTSHIHDSGNRLASHGVSDLDDILFNAFSSLGRPLDRDLFRLIRSEEHTSELQSRGHLVCRLLLEKKNGY